MEADSLDAAEEMHVDVPVGRPALSSCDPRQTAAPQDPSEQRYECLKIRAEPPVEVFGQKKKKNA